MGRPNESLDELLAQLPRDVLPPRDFWVGIERRVARQPRRMFLAVAATIAIFVTAGGVMWSVVGGRAARSAAAAAARREGFAEPHDPAYLVARADLERSFRERLGALDPGTRAKIEASLALIRQAHDQLRQALEDDPGNPVLQHLLESTWHDEFDLYDRVVRGTQPTFFRS